MSGSSEKMAAPKGEFTSTLRGYTAAKIALAVMGRIFFFYYVRVFLDLYHIDATWFQTAQILYMVWNTVNDPLFAYMQDNINLPFVKTRSDSLLYGGPIFSIVFILPWFPWEQMGLGTWRTGMHLITALCLYDTMMTFLGLAICCLFSEISQRHEDKVRLLRWSKIGPIIASVVLYFCEYTSDGLKNYFNFQVICVLIAVASYFLYRYAGRNCVTQYDAQRNDASGTSSNTDVGASRSNLSVWRLTWQILSGRNFICFVTVNFCHEFHRTFLSNFMAIFTENLTSIDDIPLGVRSFVYGFGGLIPSVLVILGAPLIQRAGYYRLVMANFYVKIFLGGFLFLGGMNRPWLLLTIMTLDNGIGSAAFSLFDMSLSDIAEEDRNKYNRRLPITSMVFGTNALVVKPVYSLAPMFTVAVLNMYGYNKLKKDSANLSLAEKDSLHSSMFYMVCCIPIVVGLIQILAWSRYTLRSTHESQPEKA